MATISVDKAFDSREELDAFVRTSFGEKADSVTIELPEEEMTRLSLSEKSTVYGAKIKTKESIITKK